MPRSPGCISAAGIIELDAGLSLASALYFSIPGLEQWGAELEILVQFLFTAQLEMSINAE